MSAHADRRGAGGRPGGRAVGRVAVELARDLEGPGPALHDLRAGGDEVQRDDGRRRPDVSRRSRRIRRRPRCRSRGVAGGVSVARSLADLQDAFAVSVPVLALEAVDVIGVVGRRAVDLLAAALREFQVGRR